jgi:2-hydroxychromene-2-carboxylate isomerase
MTPRPQLEWYFDPISPFAYLQCERLPEVEAVADVRRVPILFAGLLGHWGQKGPAEIAPKRRFTYRFAAWRAQVLGVPMRLPPAHPFDPLKLLRLAVALDARPDVVSAICRFVWAEGRSTADPAAWAALCESLGVADGDALVSRDDVKAGLRSGTERAVALGVFGVPTLRMPDGELFWGEDATDMALDYLKGAPIFRDPDMLRADDIPVGKARAGQHPGGG